MMDHSDRSTSAQEALRRHFGFAEFRAGQEEVIQAVLGGSDTLVVMPTGGGKSLCYQVPATMLAGVTVVVSPLIALMKDQVDALTARGVRATTINSTLEFTDVRQRLTDLRYGLYQMLYVAPERFESAVFLDLMRDVRVSLLAVDEAHCISEWGHDFRPSYLRLRTAIESLGRPPVVALTATATPEVQDDIIAQLGLNSPRRFVRGFDRPNLSYVVRSSENKERDLRELMARAVHEPGVSIIYAGTRKRVESFGLMLHAERLPVAVYHAGMVDADRRRAQEQFISGRARAIVATNAFGMGIDKADVRNVIHVDMPGSVEGYYQEAGRAGRDGLPSSCTMLYSERDRKLHEFFIKAAHPEREEIDRVYDGIWDMLHVAVGSKYDGVFTPEEKALLARTRLSGPTVQSALAVLESNGVLRRVKTDRLGSVRILASSRELQEYYQRTRDEDRKKTIMALLRTLGGAALGQHTLFSPEDLAARHGLTLEAFDRSMRALMYSSVLAYTPPTPGYGVQFLAERLPARRLTIDESAIARSRTRALGKLESMEEYVRASTCRRNFILDYFHAEHASGVCGRCDVCRTGGATVGPAQSSEAATIAAATPRQSARAAELLLAAAAELDGRFGKMTLVDVLRGTHTTTIDRFRLGAYSRFGHLREIDRTTLARVADALLSNGMLETASSLRPIVRITDEGRETIRHLALQRFGFEGEGRVEEERDEAEELVVDRGLLAELRAVRERVAERERLVPHRLCSDGVLARIAHALPHTTRELERIDGVTTDVRDLLGEALIDTVRAHTRVPEAVLPEPVVAGAAPAHSSSGTYTELPERLRRTLLLIEQGCSLDEISRRSALQSSTVSTQIEELLALGVLLSLERLVPTNVLRAVERMVERKPSISLKEMRVALGSSVDYPQLRIAAAWLRARGTAMGS